jgi:hypothetical protein
VKVRYRGLQKNANRLFVTCAQVCQLFCVNDQVLFLGMGARGKG